MIFNQISIWIGFLFLLQFNIIQCLNRKWNIQYNDTNLNISKYMEFEGNLIESNIHSNGFCDSKVKQLSGYFKIKGSKTKNYFYWFFESRSNPSKDPTLIWLTGGPGCSSMLALLGENGPCTVQSDLSLKENPFSWNSNANVMWIDQPAGVGFSYSDDDEYDTNEKMVGNDMYEFLQAFMTAHNEYSKQDFYVFGESYGGHFVPAVASVIYERNKNLLKTDIKINLKGIGIGNGLTNPEIQYQYYPEMAYNNTYNVKAVSKETYLNMKHAVPLCVSMIKVCQKMKAACLPAELFCNAKLVSPYQFSGLNVYDVREKCKYIPMCYDFSNIKKFLRLNSTLEKLHVNGHSSTWASCNMKVHIGFTFDWMQRFDKLIIPMLHDKIKVLIYAGDADFIVNWMGCKAWTLALDWNHREDFKNAKDENWINKNNKIIGKIRKYNTLRFVQVFNAGHMVPMNQPENSLYLLNTFLDDYNNTIEKDETMFTQIINEEQAIM